MNRYEISCRVLPFFTLLLFLAVNSYGLSPDGEMGDWKSADGTFSARIFRSEDSLIRCHLVRNLLSLDQPVAILMGKRSGELLKFSGDGWKGAFENNKLHLEKEGEKLEMLPNLTLSPTLNNPPPSNGKVIFNGEDMEALGSVKVKEWLSPTGPADNWKVVPGEGIEVVPGSGSVVTKEQFTDFFLHVEFRLLGKPTNGGIYLLSRYEINIKDSYGQIGGAPCGALGNVSEPEIPVPTLNMAAPPMQWQTFDIEFRAPRFDATGEVKTENARITLVYNGMEIYKDVEIEKVKGAAGRLGEAASGPVYFQEHGTAYQFRNIWLVDREAEVRAQSGKYKFPVSQPEIGNFNRPLKGATLDVSPPGFCWWRAGDRGEVFYRLTVRDESGLEIYSSEILDEPACIPETVFPAGRYIWTVDAVNSEGTILDTRDASIFTISEGAVPLPWKDPAGLLELVPGSHPRLLFTGEKLDETRNKIASDLKDHYSNLKNIADESLGLPLVEKPDFDRFTGRKDYAAKRTAYRAGYHNVGDTYIGGVVPMALTYLLSGEKKYGEAVKAHLLHLTGWEMDGIMSVQDPRFDEVGLRLARALPQAYDWTYDIYTENERESIENWMVSLADSMLTRMKRRDYLNYSGESHDGRVPGYLLEFSIALAEKPEAKEWMDYGMKAALTVFPHWAGADGGWAEGVSYALQYNERFITPLQSLYLSTGYNLWKKPFFSKFPYFLIYSVSPLGEVTPFGDSEDQPVSGKADKLSTMLIYYANINSDPGLRWWVDIMARKSENAKDDEQEDSDAILDGASAIRGMILQDLIQPVVPDNLPPDMAFRGIGWVAMHSDLLHAGNDLMVLFKSSPFGPVSHSHLDQNSFAIMKGGHALALPAGSRYPQHGSPFHTRYTRLTDAHNTILVNGKGQIDRNGNANGSICTFKSLPHIGYAAGEAAKAYGDPVKSYKRHILMIRPSLIIVVDEIEASEPVAIDWLMHGKEEFIINGEAESFISNRGPHSMKVELFNNDGIELSQDSLWPVDPKEGYPMVTTPSPVAQWHLTGKPVSPGKSIVIAAVMSVDPGQGEEISVFKGVDGILKLSGEFDGEGKMEAAINLNGRNPTIEGSFISVTYLPATGAGENLYIPGNESE